MERLDQKLQQRSHLSLTDYEILSVLSTAPERRLRMSDLARQVLVSRSRLTYRVDRLVEQPAHHSTDLSGCSHYSDSHVGQR